MDFIFFAFLLLFFTQLQSGFSEVFNIPLNSEASYKLYWTPNYELKSIKFEIHLTPSLNKGDWFALGFSNYGDFTYADYCFVLRDENGHYSIQDVWSDDDLMKIDERSQDCDGFSWSVRYNVTRFSFDRKFDTCDGDDLVIEDGTTHIVWLRGTQDLTNNEEDVDSISLTSATEQGMERTQLMKTLSPDNLNNREKAWSYVFHNTKLQVPTEETTYWCRVIRLPPELSETKHHVIQFESAIQPSSEGIVHHMELFHCIAPPEQDVPLYEGPCSSPTKPAPVESCKSVIAAWAMGALPFKYPKETGRPLGGPSNNPYVMLEVHYNNPEHRTGLIDNSGLRLLISKSLRRYDAGIMELGLEYTDKMAIPPRTPYFTLTGYCTSECTTVSLPSQGIKIFGSQLHTHLTGKRVVTRHIRNGRELAELNRDNHYSPHFQEIRLLKHAVTLLPGDALITTCVYNTQSRPNVTLGGFAITDEMCVNYIHYYPLIDLEVCKSSVTSENLHTFFSYMHDWEGDRTNPDKGISYNYNAIDWSPAKTRLLQEFFDQSTMSMQCNQSNGLKFPGDWENLPNTPVLYPLPPKPRYCSPK
uniref:Tyramine beta-hydroxylase n=1 Tax=Cacopsylla melanoneura TaxID=428564 RepID=A0A8D8RMC2_9HEMI